MSTQTPSKVIPGLARIAVREVGKTLEVAKTQMGIPESEKNNIVSPETPTKNNTESNTIDRDAIARQERAMLQELEAKLAQIRAKRVQEVNTYRDAQETNMATVTTVNQMEVQPQGKMRQALGKAKTSITNLISNRKKAESKQGSGKG